VSAQISGEVTG